MLGSKYKENFFKRAVRVGDNIIVNGKEFKVVGILKSVGSPTDDALVYITKSVLAIRTKRTPKSFSKTPLHLVRELLIAANAKAFVPPK